MTVVTRPRRCPSCGSRLRLLPVVYGYPTPETMAEVDRGEVFLGGCIVMGDEPDEVCSVCGLAPKPSRFPPLLPDRLDSEDIVRVQRVITAAHQAEVRQLAGGLWGHLVGDAIGVPYEFRDAASIGRVKLTGHGTHDQPPGTWSDDGALMLALLDALLDCGLEEDFDPEDQGRRFLAWRDSNAYTPDGDGAFDIGGATSSALARLRSGTPALEAGGIGERDLGNGSLMRILPIALVDAGASAETVVDRAQQASRVTHGHPRAQVACALYVLVARNLLADVRRERDRPAALADAVSTLRGVYEGGSAGAAAHLAELEELLAWTDRSGRGYVVDSFWSAWDAFAGADSYRSTIERAIGYGNDTDTTAAIAGGLAGIYWGVAGIPSRWLSALRGADIVEPMLRRLLEPLE